jgi:hypothetical protein
MAVTTVTESMVIHACRLVTAWRPTNALPHDWGNKRAGLIKRVSSPSRRGALGADQTRIIKRLKLLEASCGFAVCPRRQPSLVPALRGRAMVSENGSLSGWVPKEGSETIAAGRDDSPASLEDWRTLLFSFPWWGL